MRHNVGIRLLIYGIMTVLGLSACRGELAPVAVSPTPPIRVTQAPDATFTLVTLKVDRARYAPGDTIAVNVHNGLATPIFARDGRSDCTVVDLERWVNGSWQVQTPCVNMRPAPHVIQIAPAAILTQQLAPSLSDSIAGAWLSGTYRIGFAYVTSSAQPFGQSMVIYSAKFTIG